jgi:serine/threonine protein kinase
MVEAQNTIKLKHKNLINYRDVFFEEIEKEVFIFFVMEFYKNGDLSKHIRGWAKNKKKIPTPKLINFLIQMSEGLNFMHENKIIHRDLKPQNVLMSDDFNNLVLCGNFLK